MDGQQHSETAKTVMDVLSIGTVIGTIAQVLPAIAAIFTIVWTIIRIYETKTVQAILKRGR
jgi:chromate transport protein ChrA